MNTRGNRQVENDGNAQCRHANHVHAGSKTFDTSRRRRSSLMHTLRIRAGCTASLRTSKAVLRAAEDSQTQNPVHTEEEVSTVTR